MQKQQNTKKMKEIIKIEHVENITLVLTKAQKCFFI